MYRFLSLLLLYGMIDEPSDFKNSILHTVYFVQVSSRTNEAIISKSLGSLPNPSTIVLQAFETFRLGFPCTRNTAVK